LRLGDRRWKFINIDQKAEWTEERALGDARIYRDFCRVFIIQYNSLAPTYQEGTCPIKNLCGDTVFLKGKEQFTVIYFIKGFAKDKENKICLFAC
jgi:hypothetical protein